MRPVSDSFLNTIRGAHKAVFRARVCAPGQTGVSPTGTTINILEGDVTFDTGSDVNATMDITTDLSWPSTAASLGAPYGQEVYIERGVQYASGTQEWVGLGYFRIDRVEQANAPKGAVRITGSDRMSSIRDDRPIQPIVFTAGTSVGAVIDFVVQDAVPTVVTVYDWAAYSATLQSDHILDDDRIKFLNEILTAYGKVAYFDYAGRYQVKTPPSFTNTPVWFVNSGKNGVLCSMTRTISRDGVYNGVVATGEPVGTDLAPVRGQALDLNVTSPTYWFGSFGKVPRFFSSSFLTTNAQCDSAAASILLTSTGIPYVVELGVVPNPALEGWDVLQVQYSDKVSYEIHVIDTIKYALGADGEMAIATRKQYLI